MVKCFKPDVSSVIFGLVYKYTLRNKKKKATKVSKSKNNEIKQTKQNK